jgi:hypothetical protein
MSEKTQHNFPHLNQVRQREKKVKKFQKTLNTPTDSTTLSTFDSRMQNKKMVFLGISSKLYPNSRPMVSSSSIMKHRKHQVRNQKMTNQCSLCNAAQPPYFCQTGREHFWWYSLKRRPYPEITIQPTPAQKVVPTGFGRSKSYSLTPPKCDQRM